ncbi:hypothetical protein CYPRO_2396 [Cyclonatronum proteinivorum]|uniref:Uncharacterized protein n=1 Tax=Cyclonatronum proteinivorum TaxID=1457365 RepID=A0A345UMD6_9BACT|nr:hypothetical protein CYPRO_2396 [Cyclonatronum proteinivorum]
MLTRRLRWNRISATCRNISLTLTTASKTFTHNS